MTAKLLAKLRKHPLLRKSWSDRELNLFVADRPCATPDTPLKVGINDFQHVERFEQTTSWLDRAAFINFARTHCSDPNRYIFTVADEDGPLLGYALAEANAVQSDFGEVEQSVRWPQRTAALFGGFVHPRARGHGVHNILRTTRINFLLGERGMQWTVGAVESDNSSAMQSTLKADYFRLVATLRTRYRLGVARRSVKVIDSSFEAEYLHAR